MAGSRRGFRRALRDRSRDAPSRHRTRPPAGPGGRRRFVTAEGAYDDPIATHITHSDYYRTMHYYETRDGWYADTGANVRLGAAGCVSFGRYDLVLRVGQARDREGHLQLLPGYATLDLSLRF